MRRGRIQFHRREACYRWALMLYTFEQLALKGVSWVPPLSTLVYGIYRILDWGIPLLWIISFVQDLRVRRDRQHLITGIILALLGVSAAITRETATLCSAALILLARDLDFDRLQYAVFKSAGLALLTLVLAHLLGLTVSQAVNFAYGMGYSMGMAHPNNFSTAVAAFLLLWAYRRRALPFFRTVPLVVAAALLTFRLTLSRTSLIILLLYPFMFLMLRLPYRVRGEWLVRLVYLEFIALLAVSVSLMLLSGDGRMLPSFWGDQNYLARFTSALALYQRYGIHWFGSHIEFLSLRAALFTGREAVILDSAYLYLLIGQGIIALAVFLYLISRAIRKMIRKRQFVLLTITGLFLASGMMERYMLYPYINFPLLAAMSALAPEQEETLRPPSRRYIRLPLGRSGKSRYNRKRTAAAGR